MKSLLFALATCLPIAAPAAADDFAADRVPASARWLIHVNTDGILGSRLFAEAEKRGALDEVDWDEARRELGVDLRHAVHSITIFGLHDMPDRAVALVSTDASIERALDRLSMHVDSEVRDVDGVKIVRWSEGGDDPAYSYLASRRDSEERLLIVSNDASDLAAAVRAVRGEGATLGDADGKGLAAMPSPDALVFAVASDSLRRLVQQEASSNVARLAQSATLEIGESNEELSIRLDVTTASADDARDLVQVAQGALALAQLVGPEEPDLAPLLPLIRKLDVRADGGTVSLRFRHDTAALINLLSAGHPHTRAYESDDWREARHDDEEDDDQDDDWGRKGWR